MFSWVRNHVPIIVGVKQNVRRKDRSMHQLEVMNPRQKHQKPFEHPHSGSGINNHLCVNFLCRDKTGELGQHIRFPLPQPLHPKIIYQFRNAIVDRRLNVFEKPQSIHFSTEKVIIVMTPSNLDQNLAALNSIQVCDISYAWMRLDLVFPNLKRDTMRKGDFLPPDSTLHALIGLLLEFVKFLKRFFCDWFCWISIRMTNTRKLFEYNSRVIPRPKYIFWTASRFKVIEDDLDFCAQTSPPGRSYYALSTGQYQENKLRPCVLQHESRRYLPVSSWGLT